MQGNHGLIGNDAESEFAIMTSLAKGVMVKCDSALGHILGIVAEICMKAEQKNAKICKDVLDMQNMFENDRINQSGQSLIRFVIYAGGRPKD